MIPAFSLLGKTLTIYPILALAGIFAAGIYACRAAKRAGQSEDDMIVLLLFSAIGVFLGMHLLYGLVSLSQWPQLLSQIHSLASFFQVMFAIWGGSVFYGGLLGGIASGMPIIVRAAFRPTPSISLEQQTVSLSQKAPTSLAVRGRHDPCVAVRAVPVVEGAVALALLELWLERRASFPLATRAGL